MDDTKLVETLITLDDLFDDFDSFMFWDFFSRFNKLAQITSLAVIRDNVCFIFISMDFMNIQ